MSFDPTSAAPDDAFDPTSATPDDAPPVRDVLREAVKTDPNAAAKAAVMSKKYPAPAEVLLRNMKDAELMESVDTIADKLQQGYKLEDAMRRSLSLSRQAHDDVDTLTAIEAQAAQHGTLRGWEGPPPTLSNISKGIMAALPQGMRTTRAGLRMQMGDFLTWLGALPADPVMEASARREFGQAAAASAGTDPVFGNRTAGAVYGGVTSLARMIPGTVASIVLRNPAPALWQAGVEQQAQSYGEFTGRGAGGAEAFVAATASGGVEALTELIPDKYLAESFGKVGMKELVKNFVKKEAVGEQFATFFEDAIDTATANPEKTWGQFFDERPGRAYDTLVSTITQAGLLGAANHVAKRLADREQQLAEGHAEGLKALLALADKSELRARNPDEFRQLMQTMTDGVVYVDGEVLNQAPADVVATLPKSVLDQIGNAAASGGMVEVPVADVLAVAPGTPLEQLFVKHSRANPFSLSQTDAADVTALQERFKQEFDTAVAESTAQEETRQSAEAARKTVLDQLNAAGRYRAQVNEAMSHWAGAFYATMAQRVGMTPEEMYAKYPLRVVAEASAPGSTLEDSGKRPGALTVEGYHYSKAQRQVLSGGAYGTGLQGSGYETYANATDKRLAKRVYFYADKGTGINPEAGVGGHAHRATLTNVYDANTDPLRLRKGSQTDFESALLDAGYSGYLDRLSGTQSAQVIMLGDQSIKPEYIGQTAKTNGAVVPPEGKRASLGRDVVVDALNGNKNLPNGSPTRARWSQMLEKLMPAEHQALKDAGVFDGNQDEAVFKSELVKEFERKTEAPVYEQRPTSDAGHKRESNGRYVGAPDWVGKSPQQLATLRKKLEKLTAEGQVGRYWYEKSARAVLDMVDGDKAAAEKFIGLLAIYSSGTSVPSNTTSAIKAWYQWKAGGPITAGRFPTMMGKKAEAWLNRGEDWGGIKTNNFYTDLMEEIDPSKVDEHHSTMDMWMALAFDYGANKLDQGPKYLFAQREIKRIADNMGWRPHQVQAAIWTAIKARVEGSEKERNAYEDKKGIRIANPEGGHEIAKDREHDHFRAATRFGMESKITQAEIDASDYDFSNALQERTAQVSWEATPGASTGVLPGIHEAPMFQQEEYLAAIRKALADEKGRDLIDARLGLLTTAGDQLYSGWQGQTSVGVQQRAGVTVENGRVSGQSRLRVQLAADIRGLVLSQEGMAWHFPVYNGAKFGQNGSEFTLGRTLTVEETSALYAALSTELGHSYAPPIPTVDGFRVLNFPDEKFALEGETDKSKIKELQKASREKNDAFHEAVLRAVGAQSFNQEISSATRFETDGELRENNWANGDTDYRKRIGDAAAQLDNDGGARAPDLLKWVDDDLRPRVEAVNKDFAERYGWDNPHPEQSGVLNQSAAQQDIGRALTERIDADFEGALAEYNALPETRGGTILNVDLARELSPEYRADRTRSAEVHEAASAFIKRVFAAKLAQPTPAGKLPLVAFMAGGTGAGKSTALSQTPAFSTNAEIVLDGTMSKFASADKLIQQALEAGREVNYAYVYRDPLDAFVNGALPRAMQEGRTAPLSVLAESHAGARAVATKLVTKYADHPNVDFVFVDNSQGFGNAKVVALANLPEVSDNGLKEKLHETLQTEYQAGRISEPVYRSTQAKSENPVGEANGSGNRSRAQPAGTQEALAQSAAQPLLAPNGKPSRLSAELYALVRTPAFKNWFGDWEKFAGAEGGVWSDASGEVSKVVDENGEPLVVYHGTDAAGFEEFNRPGGSGRGDHGIFASPDWATAASYIKRGRAREIDLRDGGRGNVYAMFMNVRSPLGAGFEGANWDGQRAGKYQVDAEDGDPVYAEDGTRYFDAREDAEALAEAHQGATVNAAEDHYETTDGVARNARKGGNDGAIIYDVLDDGGGATSPFNPSTVYVAFEPEQLKSVQNFGGFDPTNPNLLAQSAAQPQTETPEFKAWFGDSKVVDAQGKPLTMYHGTIADFESFDNSKTGANDRGLWGRGHYFTSSPTSANSYALRQGDGARVIPVHVSIQNPLVLRTGSDLVTRMPDGTNTRELIGENLDGAKIKAIAMDGGHDGVVQIKPDGSIGDVVAFKPEQIKSATGNTGTFDPTNPSILGQGPRGSFNPKSLELALSPTADLSTWFHESGHFYLEVLADIASQSNAPAQIADDVNKIMAWFGVKDLAAWQAMSLDEKRRYHERFAESVEQYVMEGKAPSTELQPFFRRFRAWLLSVYKSIKQFTASKTDSAQMPLNDDVRRVMDRMLATDEQIQQANEIAGMVPDEAADAEAAERLQSRSMADLKWAVKARDEVIKKLRKQAKAVEAETREQVTAEVNQRPEVLAAEALKKAETEHETDPFSADMNAATIADAYGFASVDVMYKAIQDFGDKNAVIDALTERRMLEEHGDLVDERAIKAAANEAVHNEARARSLATELRTQREMLNPRQDTGRVASNGAKVTVNALVEAAKQFGNNVADSTVLKDLKAKVWQHTQAERRAAKAWQEATAGGKTEEAVKAKQDQLLNNAAAKAVVDAKNEAAKTFEFFKRVVKGNDETVVDKGRDPDIVNAARAVLAAYGVETTTTKAAADYLETVSKNDPETYNTIRPMVEGAMQMAQPLESLTVEQLRSLHEEIQSLWFLAKRSRQMEVDGNLMDIEDAANELHARMVDIGIPDKVPGVDSAVTNADKRKRWLQFAGALLRRVEQWSEKMDGKYGGPFLRYVFQPIKDAAEAYRSDRLSYRAEFQALLDKVAPSFTHKLIEAPEIGYTFGKGHNGIGHAELLHAILHTGNESNKRKLLLGRGWGDALPDGTVDTRRWDALLRRLASEGVLAKEHFDFAQGVWDLLEKTKPLAQKAHRDVFGRYFAEVTADPFVDPFGVQRAGGYVPAQADPLLTEDADVRALAEIENENMAFSFPATNKGFTKSRVEYNRPLKLDLRTVPQHMDKVLLFSHMEPPVRGAAKLLRNKGVSQALNRIDPSAYSGMLLPWLNRSARQIVETPIAGDGGTARVLSALRARTGAALMFANISNTVQQLTGFSSAMVKVDGKHIMRGVAQMIAHPKQTTEAVKTASEFMRNRIDNELAAMNDQMQAIILNPNIYQKAQAWSMRHSYFLQSALDNAMGPMIWIGAYNQALEQGMEDRMAVRFADGVIRQTQGANAAEDVSRLETGPAYARLFTQFIGYFNMLANTNATALQQIASEMGVKKGAGKSLGVVFLGVLAPIWIAEAIAVAFKGGPDDKDHDGYLDDWLAAVFGMGTIKGLLAQVPFVAQIGQSIANRFNTNPADDRFSLSPAVSSLESSAAVPKDVYDAIQGKMNAKKTIEDAASLISLVTGLPARAVARPLGYAAGVSQDKIAPSSAADAVRGAVTGTASPQSKVK